jgi:ATP-binding cassette subfamily F protein 3
MIRIDSVSKSFGAEEVFGDLDWQIAEEGEFIGLVGPNGAGKSTLFRILAGEMEPDTGEVVMPNDLRIAHLPQEVVEEGHDRSLLDVLVEGAGDLLEMKEELDDLETRMEQADASESVDLSSEYAELEETFRQRGGYDIRTRARKIASGLDFDDGDLEEPIGSFSGGWQRRAVLGRMLLQNPDVLLVDEPTNHLDLATLEWLEQFLADFDGTIITISHDRYFLNQLADEIAELAHGRLKTFPGNFDDYRRQRREWRERLEQKAKEQQKEREQIQEFIDKFRYNASKASMVQSRIKKLERMEEIEVPEPLTSDVSFEFPQPPRLGKTVLEVEDVAKAYGDNVVYEDLDFTIYRGDKLALVGPNGAGKSTLMKMMAGVLSPDDGSIELGHRVEVDYFAQHSLEQLDVDHTVFESMEAVASNDAYPDIRPVLGALGFSGDEVEKEVSVLSGGEKARLALARMLLEPAGCLLLDEPTNHLDIPSTRVLEEALSEFEGAICLISHDRYFLNEVVGKVVHIEAGDVTDYAGDYDYYRYKRDQETDSEPDDETSDSEETDTGSELSRQDKRRIRAEVRSERRDETESIRNRIAEIESRIEELEARQDELEAQLADPSTYDDQETDLEEINREFGQIESELESLMLEWEEKSAELETIRERYEEEARRRIENH